MSLEQICKDLKLPKGYVVIQREIELSDANRELLESKNRIVLILEDAKSEKVKKYCSQWLSKIEQEADKIRKELLYLSKRTSQHSIDYPEDKFFTVKEIEDEDCSYNFIERVKEFVDFISFMSQNINKVEEVKVKTSFNYNVVGKPKTGSQKEIFELLTVGYTQEELTVQDFADKVNKGYAFTCSQFNGRRKNENFVQAELVGLDFDNGMTIEEAWANPIIQKYAWFIYTTSSHTQEHHKFRIIFKLPRIYTDIDEYKEVIRALMEVFTTADKACKDPNRAFYGSIDCLYYTFNNTLPYSVLEDIVSEYRNKKEPKYLPKIITHDEYNEQLKKAEKIFYSLPQHIEYEEYLSLLSASVNVFGKDIAQEMSQNKWGNNKDGHDSKYKVKTLDGTATIATFFFLGKKYGVI